jgi:hypothetical protein
MHRRGTRVVPATVTALAVAAALPACSGDDDSSAERAPAPPPQLTNAVRLKGGYTLNGRAHRVDARIGFDHVIDPYRASASAPPPKARFVGAQLHLLNRGQDPFPIQWARFRGYDERGRPLPAGTQSTPLRRSMPDRPVRGQVLTQITGFTVPRGRRLASIRLSSIVDAWRFRARWTLPR